jgi:hypothetical protein
LSIRGLLLRLSAANCQGAHEMDEMLERRLAERFPQAARLEIQIHCREGWGGRGDLVDCSESGVGFHVAKRLKQGTVVLLRVAKPLPRRSSHGDQDATRFNMVTAKVRWCRELPSPAGIALYRVGAKRMLPFY